MSESQTPTSGYGLIKIGLRLRRASGRLAVALAAAIAAGALARVLGGTALPRPLAVLGSGSAGADLGTWLWQGAVLFAVCLFGGRIFAFCVGGAGWLLVPADERELLVRVAGGPQAPDRLRVAGPDPA